MYKKILINGPESLPEKSGRYFCHDRYSDMIIAIAFIKDNQGVVNTWLDNVNWYLIESPINVPTEEEVKIKAHNKATNIINSHIPWEQLDNSLMDRLIDMAKWAIDEIIKRNK